MPPPSRRQPPPRRVRPRPFPTSPRRDETCPLGRRATTIVSTLTTVDPPTISHAQRPTATAAETRLFARVADRSPSSDASASLDAATSPDLRDHLRDHLRDDHAVAIRDGRTDAETAACDARLAAARARVASFSTRVRAAGGGVGGVATLPDTHGDYGTLRRRGDAWTAFNKRPDRVRDALAADPNLPRCPHLVGNAPSRLPHVLVSHRDAPGLSRAALGAEGRVRVAAYCAQCWENLETKRLAAAVACADCGDAFPRGKTRAYPVLTRPGAGRVDVDVFSKRHVDVCFLCAPRWEVRAAEDAERRARDEVEDAANASADAAARAFAELPMDERVAIVDAELRRRKGADGEGADGESADGEGADGARVDGEGADGMPVDGHPVDGMPTLGRVPAAPRHPRDADALYAAAETETAAAERLTAELVDSDARASSSARAARPGETHALLPRRAYDDPRDERRKPHDRPLRLGAADLAESAILRAMLRDGKYEEMLEFARRVEPPTDPTDGGDGGADVPLGNRALAEADATATAARRAVVATAREHLGDDAKANEAADVVERAAERAAVAAMTSAGLLRTDRGEDPRGDVGESAALVSSNPRVDPSSVLADALRRFGDDADAAVAAAAAAESRATAEAFRARALGDAAAAEARALAADRARLLEIIDAERGAYPLAANPAAVAEAAEKEAREGASKKASEAAFWGDVGLDDDEGEREETPEERDAREREERAKEAEEARRRARDERFAKLERWARSGVDLSAYDEADEGGSNANGDGEQSRQRGRRPDAGHAASELLAFRARVAAALEDTESRLAADAFLERRAGAPKEAPNGASSETSKESAHAASKEEAWLCRLRASLLETRADVDEALARADVDPRDADVDPRSADWSTTSNPQDRRRSRERRKSRRRRRRPERSRRPDRHPRLRSSRHPLSRRGRDRSAFRGVSSRRIVSRRVVSEGVSASEPVGGGVGARARETPREKTAPRETTSDGGRVRLGGRRPRAPRAPEGRAKTTSREDDDTEGVEGDDVDPRVERIDRIERGGEREHGSFSRRRSRRRRVRVRPVVRLRLGRLGRSVDSSSHGASRRRRTPHRALPRGRGEIPGPTGLVARRVPAGRRFRFPSRSRRDRESRPRPPGGHGVRTGVGASRNSRSRGARPPSRANPGPRSRRRRRGGGRPDTRRGGGGGDSQSRRRRTADSLRRRYRDERRQRRQYHDRTKTRGCVEPGTRVRSRGRGREASRRTRDASARDARVVDDRKGTFAKPSAGDGRGRTRRRASPRAHATHPRRVTR